MGRSRKEMKKDIIFRIIYDLVVLLAVFVLPWWLSSILVILGLFLFRSFYEIFIPALAMDSLYGNSGGSFVLSNIFSIFAVILFLLSYSIKTRFSF